MGYYHSSAARTSRRFSVQDQRLVLLRVIVLLNRGAQRLNRQSRRVVFARRQTTERIRNFLSRQLHRVRDLHSFDHFSEDRTAGQRRRATVGQKARGFDATITDAQTQAETIAAYGICLFRDRVRVREFAGIARIREMIFESF